MSRSPDAIEKNYLQQSAQVSQMALTERDSLIVSIVNVDGIWQVLSRYGDIVWRARSHATNTPLSEYDLNFRLVPTDFHEGMKAFMWQYIRKGRAGHKRPGPGAISRLFRNALPFIRHVARLKLKRFSDITPLVCSTYADSCKAEKTRSGRPLSQGVLCHRFIAVEALYELTQHSKDAMPHHPWQDSSGSILAGLTGSGAWRKNEAKTPLIPDDAFCALFQAAFELVQRGDQLLDLRDALETAKSQTKKSKAAINRIQSAELQQRGWNSGLRKFNVSLQDLRTACYIVVASLSGCRNCELAFLQSNSCYRTEGDDGEIYWWMKSRSPKTDTGDTEWMIPEAAVKAIKVMDRWALPYQSMIARELAHRREANPTDPGIAEAVRHQHAIFLGATRCDRNQVRTLSFVSWRRNLKAFASKYGVDWEFTTHQFRRKFAQYAARSKFGDLRYLKQHFKHWTMDMTLLYAVNRAQDLDLFLEITDELDTLRENKVAEWLEPHTPLSGGAGRSFVEYRGTNPVKLFASHSAMIATLSENIAIRSNGHAWCTADSGIDCVGNGGLDRTRCADCNEAVIGTCHGRVYQGLYDHLQTLLHCRDIGESGLSRVRRDISRCANVLRDLGYDPERGNVG